MHTVNINDKIITSGIRRLPEYNSRQIEPVPIAMAPIWQKYLLGMKSHWFEHELRYDKDYFHLTKLSDTQIHTCRTPIIYFLESDNNIAEYISEIPKKVYGDIMWINRFYSWKEFNEGLHAITYERMFGAIVPDVDERNRLRETVSKIPAIENKNKWLGRVIEGIDRVEQAHIASLAMEGINFSPSFKFFQNLQVTKVEGEYILPGLCRSNELIMRDESLHTQAEAVLYNMSENKLDENDIYPYLKQATELEDDFIDYMFPKPFLTMTRETMYENARLNCNNALSLINIDPLYEVSIHDGMHLMTGLSQKSSFFEVDATEYITAGQSNFHDIYSDDF